MAFACETSGKMSVLAGKIDESVVEILTSESGVLRYEEVSGETVNPFFVDADTLSGSTKEEIISEAQSGIDLSNVDAATLDGHDVNYFATASNVEECFQSVSSGKAQIASAITDKGVSTSPTASFSTMASKILSISKKSELDAAILNKISIQNCSSVSFSQTGLPQSVVINGDTYTLQSTPLYDSGDLRYYQVTYKKGSSTFYIRFSLGFSYGSWKINTFGGSNIFSSIQYQNLTIDPRPGGAVTFLAAVTFTNGSSYDVTISGNFSSSSIEIYGSYLDDGRLQIYP